ncbi:IclR family transcriptional regulator [Halorussus marinus]|uniref:IclR family transcriptional regulator n=1 Tax=Halorussus marinus TaxID=2505976 RepID=UPI0010928138|nr:IclR family transcriptional regulator [Halorussus marinus]
MTADDVRTLKTVETTSRILNALQRHGNVGVTELSNELELSKGAVYNHLATLRKQGFVVKKGDEYQLSNKFINYGKSVQHQSPLYTVGKEYVDRLAEKTDEYAHLMVEENGLGYYLYRERGENAIAEEFHAWKNQKPDYLHHSSTGKAILAEFPCERVEEVIEEHGLPQSTEKTITTKEALFDELEKTRERGYAIYDGEEVSGTRAVGVAIVDKQSNTYGAISVSGAVTRMQGSRWEEEIPQQVKRTANLIEIDLQTKTHGETPESKK